MEKGFQMKILLLNGGAKMNEMKWYNISEFPPNDTKTSSKTVIVLKKSGRTMRAYYLFPEKRWILARNGKRMNTKNLIAWRFESVSFLDLEQQREDEEQSAYLAEWSRRHRKCK